MAERNDGTWETDAQFTEQRIAKVADQKDGKGWSLEFEDGWSLYCPRDQCDQAPVPGETARLYGKGLGHQVRGIVIDARVYSYLTDTEDQARHEAWIVGETIKRQDELDRSLADRDRRRAALPSRFQERLAGFEAARPDWRRDHEGYELFVCEEAVKLAERFSGDVAGLRAFWASSFEEQKAAFPGLAYDQHSGNTWGAAGMLARLYLERPVDVPLMHGALCPLVGCGALGCAAARGQDGVEA